MLSMRSWANVRPLVLACGLWIAAAGDRPVLADAEEDSGLQIFTRATQDWMAADAIGLRYRGVLDARLAEELAGLLIGTQPAFRHVVLELDSEGGDLEAVQRISGVLKAARKTAELTTRVMGGGTCASGCIAVFMQGEKRKASGASVWVFHGACPAGSNIPSLSATKDYLDLLADAGASEDFLCKLAQEGYVTRPGAWMISGYELFHVYHANIITELLPAWQPEEPQGFRLMIPR